MAELLTCNERARGSSPLPGSAEPDLGFCAQWSTYMTPNAHKNQIRVEKGCREARAYRLMSRRCSMCCSTLRLIRCNALSIDFTRRFSDAEMSW